MSDTLMAMVARARSSATEIAPDAAAAAFRAGDIELIVDVREPAEFAESHLADAVCIPRGVLELRADPTAPVSDPALTSARTERILVYCTQGPGARSLLSAQTLSAMGYEHVEVLAGGLTAWSEAGLPIRGQAIPAQAA